MKAWLKGGLILIVIYIVFILLAVLLNLMGLDLFGNNIFFVFAIFLFPAIILMYLIPGLGACTFQGFGSPESTVGCLPESIILIIYLIFAILFWFLIGALIGLIIGKLKSKKSQEVPKK